MSLKTVQFSFACMGSSSVVILCACSAVYCHSDELIVFGSMTNKNDEQENILVKKHAPYSKKRNLCVHVGFIHFRINYFNPFSIKMLI